MLVRFWFRKSQTKKSGGTIYGYITVNGVRSKEFSTFIRTTDKNWNAQKQELRGDDAIYNSDLYLIREKLHDIRRAIEKADGVLSADAVMRTYLMPTQQLPTFLEVLELFLAQRAVDVSTGLIVEETHETDRKYANNLKAFIAAHRLPGILCGEWTEKLVHVLLDWIIKQNGKKRAYANRHVTFLKMVVKYAIRQEYADRNKLTDIQLKHDKQAKPMYLTKEEVALLEATCLPGRFRRIADAYLVMCYTGLALTDYTNLSSSDLRKDDDGFEWLEVYRGKTDILAIIPIGAELRALIDKYGGIDGLPKYSEPYFNTNLREAAARCGIEKYLTTHTGRKTYAKKLLREQRKPLVIAKMMGWTSTGQLKRYADIDKDDVKEEFRR